MGSVWGGDGNVRREQGGGGRRVVFAAHLDSRWAHDRPEEKRDEGPTDAAFVERYRGATAISSQEVFGTGPQESSCCVLL